MITRRTYGHPDGPDAPPTTAEVFEQYEDDAVQFALDQMTDDGLDSPLILWMEADDGRKQTLRETFDSLAHMSLTSSGDKLAGAIQGTVTGMRFWAEKYVGGWDNAQKNEFIWDKERSTEEAVRLDRQEGIWE